MKTEELRAKNNASKRFEPLTFRSTVYCSTTELSSPCTPLLACLYFPKRLSAQTHRQYLKLKINFKFLLAIPKSVPDVRKFRPFTMNLMTDVSILFADIAGFTKMSSNKSADELVNLLNDLFGRYGRIL